MKNKKLFIASVLAGVSALTLATATACDGLPTWLGGKGPTYKVVISINGVDTEMEVGKGVIPEKPADPVKDGYDFKGWYLDEACTKEYKFDKPLEGNCSLYAYFTEKTYPVTFVVDGKQETVDVAWSKMPTYETPKKDGYVFKTWCLDEACTQDFVFVAPVKQAITVYAKFAQSYKVNYVLSPDGTALNVVETENGTAPVKPREPQVEGYEFQGWFLDASFKTAYNFDTVLDAGATIYAKFAEKEYTVTYMIGGTETVIGTPVTYKYWTIPTQPQDPTNGGEYFFGWYLDEEYKDSYDFSYSLKEDTTVYAQFMEYKPIYTAEELQAIAENPSANYALMNDIRFKGTWTPLSTFSGKFDGNGYKIYDFRMSSASTTFGFIITNNGTIKNLTLSQFDFSSNCFADVSVGVLVCTNNGTIENCAIDNPTIDGENAITFRNVGTFGGTASRYAYYGGLVASNSAKGIIKNCSFIGEISVTQETYANNGTVELGLGAVMYVEVGGIVANNTGTITGAYSDFKVNYVNKTVGTAGNSSGRNDSAASYIRVAGIASQNKASATISKSEALVDISVSTTVGSCGQVYSALGGIVVGNYNTITETIARGSITHTGSCTELYIGGFACSNSDTGIISDCYADTTLSGAGYIGGFAYSNSNIIERCYALGTITSSVSAGGFVRSVGENAQVNYCFSNVDITTSSSAGAFVVSYTSGTSPFYRCYYSTDAVIMKGGEEYESAEVSNVVGKTTAEICDRELLMDKMWWNSENEVWVIDGENLPTLIWEKA